MRPAAAAAVYRRAAVDRNVTQERLPADVSEGKTSFIKVDRCSDGHLLTSALTARQLALLVVLLQCFLSRLPLHLITSSVSNVKVTFLIVTYLIEEDPDM